jgi:glycosyltransferase involved in cell wall biosynthesis
LKKVLAITVWDYSDPLIQVYTLPYLKIVQRLYKNTTIYLQTFEKNGMGLQTEIPQGIVVFKAKFARSFLGKTVQYFKTISHLASLARKEDIAVIQAFCTPGAMIGYLVSKLSGKPLMIDSLEPHAECMVESGTWSKQSPYFKTLFLFEKLSVKHARATISVTPTVPVYVKEKYKFELTNNFYKPACVDVSTFDAAAVDSDALRRSLGVEGEVVCVYVGKFGDLYLEDEVFDFFVICSRYWAGRFKVLLLTSQSQEYIYAKAAKSGLPKELIIQKFADPTDVPKYLALASFAISPFKSIPTRRYCTPIKNGEYWAAGLPVVITKDISMDSDIIEDENIGYVLKGLNTTEYEKACVKINALIKDHELRNKIKRVASMQRGFDLAEKAYKGAFPLFGFESFEN